MLKTQLAEELQKGGLSTAGKKEELLLRLEDDIRK